MNDRTYRDLRTALHDLGASLIMPRQYLAPIEKTLQAGSYPESREQLRKVQEARIRFRDEVSALAKVCKAEIPEPDPPGTANPSVEP